MMADCALPWHDPDEVPRHNCVLGAGHQGVHRCGCGAEPPGEIAEEWGVRVPRWHEDGTVVILAHDEADARRLADRHGNGPLYRRTVTYGEWEQEG